MITTFSGFASTLTEWESAFQKGIAITPSNFEAREYLFITSQNTRGDEAVVISLDFSSPSPTGTVDWFSQQPQYFPITVNAIRNQKIALKGDELLIKKQFEKTELRVLGNNLIFKTSMRDIDGGLVHKYGYVALAKETSIKHMNEQEAIIRKVFSAPLL